MKKTLLIADGDAELCDLYRRFLSARGYDVESSSDGLDCVAKLRRMKPAALVLDPELRWGGGVGVLAWLREESLMPGLPIILTATSGYPKDFAEFIEPNDECVRSAVARDGLRETSKLNRDPRYSELFIG